MAISITPSSDGQNAPTPQDVSDAWILLRWSIDRLEATLPYLLKADPLVYNVVIDEFRRFRQDYMWQSSRLSDFPEEFPIISRLQGRANNLIRQAVNVELLPFVRVRALPEVRENNHLDVIDVRRGLPFTLNIYSIYTADTGHIDVEPIDGAWATISRFRNRYCWCSRPVWVVIGNRTIAAALHNFPHSSNGGPLNRAGHLCLHFHETGVDNHDQRRNARSAVAEAWEAWSDPGSWNTRISSEQHRVRCLFRNRDTSRPGTTCSNFRLVYPEFPR